MKILLVEDNEVDIVLTKFYLEETYPDLRLEVVINGADAIDFILQQHEFSHCEEPDLIILDLCLPKIDGLEILQIVKNTQSKSHIPIIIFTASILELDKNFAFQNGALAFMEKPFNIKELNEIISANGLF
ncbi:MAG: response regulator [Bacteroidota bacterium]